ncbi:MAG: hypothetical protein KGP14_17085, partial [Betaproteobacteria bacterium]|nr:hypothetical protein [Betaproteobacteria bacterium]
GRRVRADLALPLETLDRQELVKQSGVSASWKGWPEYLVPHHPIFDIDPSDLACLDAPQIGPII